MKRIILILTCLSIYSSCAINKVQSTNLKIMTYNIRHGEGLDTIQDLSRSTKIINSIAPDLVGLQEIDNFCTRTDSVDQTDYLARKTSMTGTFGEFMKFQGGEYGMATLSAKPLISTKVLQLPDGKYEPRSLIVHEVQISEDHSIVFANVHFEWISGTEGDLNRLNQAKELVSYIDKFNKAVIITGDFNCTPNSPTMQYFADQGFEFVQKGNDNLSFQGEEKSEIDHLIYRNTDKVKFETQNVFLVVEPLVSDHRPLVVELKVTLK